MRESVHARSLGVAASRSVAVSAKVLAEMQRIRELQRRHPSGRGAAQARGAAHARSGAARGARVLVADDDAELCQLIADFLIEQGLSVVTAGDAVSLDRALATETIDLIVLDIMMPGEDGLSILGRLPHEGRPGIIMLSAMGSDRDRACGLELGADDYVAKPCNPRELLARIRAVLRRRERAAGFDPGQRRVFGGFTVDMVTRRVRCPRGNSVQLTDSEFRVLNALLDSPDTLLSRDYLLDVARGETAYIYDRAIDVTISRIRRKIGAADLICTVRGGGYMLRSMDEA